MTRRENRRKIVEDLFCDDCGRPVDSCVCNKIERPERRQHNRTKKK